MAILILEDGTGLINSNSYQTVQDFKDYFTRIGVDVSAYADAQINDSLINVAENILQYCYTYKGEISFPLVPQALLWPRTGLCDRRGLEIATTTIPDELKKAQNELARSNLMSRINFSDTPSNQGAVKREKLDVMEIEYFSAGTSARTTIEKSVLDWITKLLAPYIFGGGKFQANNVAVT